jgi:hypothetical protein
MDHSPSPELAPIGATTVAVRRTAGVAGIAFVVTLVVTVILTGASPGTDSTGDRVELYAINHYHSLQGALVFGALAALSFMVFAGQLSARLRKADAAAGDSWAPTFLLGAAGTVMLQLAALAVQGGYQELSHSGALPGTVLELFRAANGLLAASGAPLAVMLVSISVSGLLNGTVPVPLAWLGALTATVALVSVGGVGTARTSFGVLYDASTLLLLVWVLAVSLWLLLRRDEPAVEPTRP